MPRVQITLNDGTTKTVELDDGFTDSDIDEIAGQLNSQIKPQQTAKPAQQPIQQPVQQSKQQPIDKQAEVDRIRAEFAEKNKQIDRENRKAMGRISAGALLQGASGLPIFNIPYIGTGAGGALFELGQGLMEGDKANDLLKRTGTGFAIGETIGAIPYVGKLASKTKAGQAVGNTVGKLAETELAKKTGQILSTNVDNNAAGQAIAKVGNALGVGKTIPQKVELKTNAGIVKPETINLTENEAVKRGLSIETAKAQIEKLQKGKEYRINNAARVKFTGEFDSSGMPIFENDKGTKQAYSLTNVFDEIPAIDKVTKKGLEADAKQTQNDIKDLQVETTKPEYVTRSKQGRFWKVNIDDDLTKGIREAETELNNVIKEIQNNPEIVNDFDKVTELENRLVNKLGIDNEFDSSIYDKFNEAITKADDYNKKLLQAGKMKQAGLPGSVINAKGTPKEVKQILKNDFPEYQLMHNNELTNQAVQEVESNFNNELSRLTSAKDFEALDYEKSRQIAKRLFDAGRHEEAINLIDNVSENATKKGQAIQALSLWSNMTPEGAVYKAEKLIKEYNKKVPARKQITLKPEQIEQIRSLQDAALSATDDLERTQGLARTAKYVSELVPKNIGQKLKAYRNISLLLNPKTLGRNIVGNTLFNAVDTVSKAAAVPIDRAIGLVTGNKTRVAPQINELVKGGLKGAKTGFQEALEGIDTRGLGKRFDLQEGRTFKNPVMQKLETALDVGLRVPDRTQYEATFAESVANMMKAQGLKEPTQEILEQAEKEALESVFQNDSAIADLTTKVRRAMNTLGTKDFGLGDLAIPYAQTPANLVQQAINYSPLGAVKGISNLAQGNQRQASLDLARALMGTGIIGSSYGLSQNGNITPSQFNEDYQKNRLIKANLATMGIKPETINGVWYAPFQPMSTSIAIGNAMANGEAPLQAGLNTMLDLPFLQNVNRGLADIKDKGIAEAGINFAGSLPAQFVPTVASQIGQTIDPYQRETYDANKLKQGLNQAIAKVPIASQTLPEKIDVQGKPIERYTSEGAQRMFDIFVNPTYINEPTNDTVMNELKALYDETGDTKQFLPIVDKKLKFKDANGEEQRIELTGEQLSNYQKVLGSRLYKEYAELMQTNRYQNADDETRIELLSKGKQKAKNAVDAELFNKPSVQSRKKVKDPTAKLKRLQNKIDKQLIDSIFTE